LVALEYDLATPNVALRAHGRCRRCATCTASACCWLSCSQASTVLKFPGTFRCVSRPFCASSFPRCSRRSSALLSKPTLMRRPMHVCRQPPWVGSMIRVCTALNPDARLPFSRLHDWLFTGGLSLAYVAGSCLRLSAPHRCTRALPRLFLTYGRALFAGGVLGRSTSVPPPSTPPISSGMDTFDSGHDKKHTASSTRSLGAGSAVLPFGSGSVTDSVSSGGLRRHMVGHLPRRGRVGVGGGGVVDRTVAGSLDCRPAQVAAGIARGAVMGERPFQSPGPPHHDQSRDSRPVASEAVTSSMFSCV
jgi:hypothetical protein